VRIAYSEGHSLFHEMDPLTKFVWCFLVAVWLLSLRQLGHVIFLSLILLIVAVLGANIDIVQHMKTTLILFTGGAFLIIYQGYFQPGPGIDIWAIHFSYRGIELGFALTLRTIGLVASSLAFSRTTRPKDMALAMEQLGMSYRYSHVIYLALRFIPLFERDMQLINDAQKLRRVEGGLTKLTKTTIAMLATELRRVDETAIALETRGFGLHKQRTNLEKIAISRNGTILVACTTLLMIVHLLLL
jgi:energy-coupling factor transport system permease protein